MMILTRKSLKLSRTAAIVFLIVAISTTLASAEMPSAVPEQVLRLEKFRAAPQLRMAPEQAFYLDGETPRRFADYQGQGLVVNFWATWCPPCVAEMPDLQALRRLLKDEGIEVLTLSEDRTGMAVVAPFFEQHGLDGLDRFIDRDRALAKRLAIGGLPTTVIIDRQGRVLGRVVGVIPWSSHQTIAALRRLIGGTAPAPESAAAAAEPEAPLGWWATLAAWFRDIF